MKWITCSECDTEFRVISDSKDLAEYCPFCGHELTEEDDIEDLEDYD